MQPTPKILDDLFSVSMCIPSKNKIAEVTAVVLLFFAFRKLFGAPLSAAPYQLHRLGCWTMVYIVFKFRVALWDRNFAMRIQITRQRNAGGVIFGATATSVCLCVYACLQLVWCCVGIDLKRDRNFLCNEYSLQPMGTAIATIVRSYIHFPL